MNTGRFDFMERRGFSMIWALPVVAVVILIVLSRVVVVRRARSHASDVVEVGELHVPLPQVMWDLTAIGAGDLVAQTAILSKSKDAQGLADELSAAVQDLPATEQDRLASTAEARA